MKEASCLTSGGREAELGDESALCSDETGGTTTGSNGLSGPLRGGVGVSGTGTGSCLINGSMVDKTSGVSGRNETKVRLSAVGTLVSVQGTGGGQHLSESSVSDTTSY